MEKKELMTLGYYEARLQAYKEQTMQGVIGIGRTLSEAKAARVVPHGQWEAWVEAQTGLSVRKAQRFMQLAQEVGEGSGLMALEPTKALRLLGSGLDEDTRESIAAEAAQGMSDRELQKRIQEEREKAIRETESRMRAQENADRDKLAERLREHYTGQMESLSQCLSTEQRETLRLRDQVDRLERQLASAVDDSEKEALKAQLCHWRKEAAEADRLRQEAVDQLMDFQSGAANREALGEVGADSGFHADDLTACVASFLGACGMVPLMGAAFGRMTLGELQQWRDQVDMVAQWVTQSRAAMDACYGEGCVI